MAVIIDNFKKIKQISNGSAFMTSQQREWVRLQKASPHGTTPHIATQNKNLIANHFRMHASHVSQLM